MPTPMKNKQSIELIIIRVMLAAYIIMALILAGLNFGYAEQATADVAALINRVWHFYENWIKTVFIAVGGYLTLRITGDLKKTSLRRKNLQGFLIFALIVHIAGPYLFSNPDLYYFAMPLPWTNLPLQLLVPESAFYKNFSFTPGCRRYYSNPFVLPFGHHCCFWRNYGQRQKVAVFNPLPVQRFCLGSLCARLSTGRESEKNRATPVKDLYPAALAVSAHRSFLYLFLAAHTGWRACNKAY